MGEWNGFTIHIGGDFVILIFKVCVKVFNKSGVLNLTQRKEIYPSLSFKQLFKMNVVIIKVMEINNFSKNYRSMRNFFKESYRMIGRTEAFVYCSSLWAFDLSLFLGPSLTDFFRAIRIKGVRVLNLGFLEFESFESDWMWLGVIEGLENNWEWFSTKTLGERVRKIERE